MHNTNECQMFESNLK